MPPPTDEDIDRVLGLWEGKIRLDDYWDVKLMCNTRFTTAECCFPCHLYNNNGHCYHVQAVLDGDANFVTRQDPKRGMSMRKTHRGRKKTRLTPVFLSTGYTEPVKPAAIVCPHCIGYKTFTTETGRRKHLTRVHGITNVRRVTNPRSIFFKKSKPKKMSGKVNRQ